MNIYEMIAVLTAYKNGEQIQSKHGNYEWQYNASPIWDFANTEYRVKPKPLELWVNIYSNNKYGINTTARDAATARSATSSSDYPHNIIRCAHMVEVDE